MKSFKRAIYKILQEEEDTQVLSCSGTLSAEGQLGVYEVKINIGTELGYTGIQYDSYSIPDRFQIIYDGNIVADSKYVGNTSYFSSLIGTYNVTKFLYEDGEFIDSGLTEEVVVTQDDISDGSPSEPTSGQGVISFNRQDRNQQFMTIRVTGVLNSTLWNLQSICPQENPIKFTKKYLLTYGGSVSSIDCTNPSTPQEYYLNTDNLTLGSVIFKNIQRTQKAKEGYYLYGAIIYYFDGNSVIDSIPCAFNLNTV